MTRPPTYAAAAKLGVDGAAVLSSARELWLRLTNPQRSALRRAVRMSGGGHGQRLAASEHLVVARALEARGLVTFEAVEDYLRPLTVLGLLVREAGLAHDAELAEPRRKKASAA